MYLNSHRLTEVNIFYGGQQYRAGFIREGESGLDFEGKGEQLERCVCTVHEGREGRKAGPQCYMTTGVANGRGCPWEQHPQRCAVYSLHGHMQ